MSSEIIYQGIYITAPGCKYFQVKTGTAIRGYKNDSVYTIEFPEGTKSEAVAKKLGLKHIGAPRELTGMPHPERFGLVEFSLNGLKFWRMTYDPHIVKIIIVSDSESRIVQSYKGTTIVVSKDDYANPEFIKYVLTSGGLKFIKLAGSAKCIGDWEFRNFPFIPIYDTVALESESKVVYSLRNRYDDYLIRSIDYQEQFIREIRRILEDYGVELVRINREETLRTTSYVSYNFPQTPVNANHPKWSTEDNGVLHHRVPVDFELRCTNMQMFYDFKNKYSNVNLLTNMCEFRTTDRYGERWTAAVKWGPITEDFSQQYSSDSNSNFSYQCSFRAELFFTEVFDQMNALIQTIYYELEYD